MTKLPANKTKIVCTIGPASESPDMMRKLLEAGMNVARLNFSHGDFSGHAKVIANLRAAAKAAGRRVAIMGDLPGPKMRIGMLKDEPIDLIPGDIIHHRRRRISWAMRRSVSMHLPACRKRSSPATRSTSTTATFSLKS